MNNHPISSSFSIKEQIYKFNLLQIFMSFFLIFFCISILFFLCYTLLFTMDGSKYSPIVVFKYSLFQSVGFDIDEVYKGKSIFYEILNFIQLFISLIINLLFTSAIVLKYFTKPSFFQFKKKVNIDKDLLIISLYNKTDFQITNCKFEVYARLPYIDEDGMNSLNNVKLYPIRDKFPFMDKHLVTRLRIDLSDSKNKTDFSDEKCNESLLSLLDVSNLKQSDSVQYLRITILIEAISDKLDSNIYEIQNYEINVRDKNSINSLVTFEKPNGINIDSVDFTKSTGWEKFED